MLTGANISPGDVILGLASSGVHSNGFSLVRRIVAEQQWNLGQRLPSDRGRTLGEVLLEPTRIYVRALLPLVQQQRIKGLAHITGGGLLENIPRVLPDGCHAMVDADRWPLPPIFALLQEGGAHRPGRDGADLQLRHRHGRDRRRSAADAVDAALEAAGETVVPDRPGRSRAGAAARSRAQPAPGARPKDGPQRMMRDPRRVAILISGRGSNMRALVERADGYEVALIASNKPQAAGLAWAREPRARRPGPAKARASGGKSSTGMLSGALDDHRVGTVALAGFMRILSPWFVDRWRGRVVNIHPSLLPKYQGPRHACRGRWPPGDTGQRLLGAPGHGRARRRGRCSAAPKCRSSPAIRRKVSSERVLAAEHALYPKVLSEFVRR